MGKNFWGKAGLVFISLHGWKLLAVLEVWQWKEKLMNKRTCWNYGYFADWAACFVDSRGFFSTKATTREPSLKSGWFISSKTTNRSITTSCAGSTAVQHYKQVVRAIAGTIFASPWICGQPPPLVSRSATTLAPKTNAGHPGFAHTAFWFSAEVLYKTTDML